MRRIRAVHAIVMLYLVFAGTTFAQAPAPKPSAPATRLEARVVALEKRIAVLEANLVTAAGSQPLATPTPSRGNKGAPIVYFEVAGPEAQPLKTFYSTVFAWDIDASATIAASSTGGVRGGIRQDPPEKLLYLGVPNIEQALKLVEAAGGKTLVRRTVVPGVVTFALFSDPAGNRMGLAEFGSYK